MKQDVNPIWAVVLGVVVIGVVGLVYFMTIGRPAPPPPLPKPGGMGASLTLPGGTGATPGGAGAKPALPGGMTPTLPGAPGGGGPMLPPPGGAR